MEIVGGSLMFVLVVPGEIDVMGGNWGVVGVAVGGISRFDTPTTS